jgi:hypothetical protein
MHKRPETIPMALGHVRYNRDYIISGVSRKSASDPAFWGTTTVSHAPGVRKD